VCLLGCCANSGERVLVYEFMVNGTLHDQLHSRSPVAASVSSWRGRLTIVLERGASSTCTCSRAAHHPPRR
jgi:hypothetical protein